MTTCNNMAPAGEIPASTDEGSEVTCAYQSGTANQNASIANSITPPPSPPPPSPPQEDDEDGEAIDFSKQKKRKGAKKMIRRAALYFDRSSTNIVRIFTVRIPVRSGDASLENGDRLMLV